MKTFNTHIEALKYIANNPNNHTVKGFKSSIQLTMNEVGDVYDIQNGKPYLLSDFQLPFTAVEPEKTNIGLAKELNQ